MNTPIRQQFMDRYLLWDIQKLKGPCTPDNYATRHTEDIRNILDTLSPESLPRLPASGFSQEKELVYSQPIPNFSERMPQGTGFGLVSHGTLLERDSAATWGRIETMVWTDRSPPLLTSGQLNNNNKTPSSKLPPGEGKSIHASNTLTSMQLPKELVSILELWQVRHSPTAWRRMDMVV